MGTETCSDFILTDIYEGENVKLNNPLMGTETKYYRGRRYQFRSP